MRLEQGSNADFELLRYAERLMASAIGAASSRLVLSLLLRQRTVSTKAALKLLDDANAAIHYNREILQTALDHVRQGIAVYDKDMRLICWNRQFGEILDLPPELTRIGTGLDEIVDVDQHGQAAVYRQRGLRLVEQVQPTRPEPVGDQVEVRLAVGPLVQAATAVAVADTEPVDLGGHVVERLGAQEEPGARLIDPAYQP